MGMVEALNAGAVFADINVRTEGFKKSMATVVETLNRVDKRFNETAKNMNLTKVAEGMAKAGQKATLFFSLPLAALAGLSVKASSDLNETISKTQEIFGQATDDMLKWAKTADTTVGMSQRVALDSAASFALFGKSAGLAGQQVNDFSKENVKLAADLASFFNTSPEDAITAIGAALRGQTEPIRRYNVLLDDISIRQEAVKQGIISTTKQALTPQQRILAVHALIMKQTSAAQGDFARTSDELANKQRIVKSQVENTIATLGNQMLPVVLAVTTRVSDLVAWISTWDESTIKLAIALGVAVAAAGPLMTVVGKGISTFQNISSVIGAVTAAMNGKTIADGSNAAAVAAHTIVTKINIAWTNAQAIAMEGATVKAKALRVAMMGLKGGVILGGVAIGLFALKKAFDSTIEPLRQMKREQDMLNDVYKRTNEELDRMTGTERENIRLMQEQHRTQILGVQYRAEVAALVAKENRINFDYATAIKVNGQVMADLQLRNYENQVRASQEFVNEQKARIKEIDDFSKRLDASENRQNKPTDTSTADARRQAEEEATKAQTDRHEKWLEYIMDEIELENERYKKEKTDLDAAGLNEQQYQKASLKLAKEHERKLAEIEKEASRSRIDAWKSSFEFNTDIVSKFESIYEAKIKGTVSATQAAAMQIVAVMTSAFAGINDAMSTYFSAQSQMIDDRYDYETQESKAYQAYQDEQDRIAYQKLSSKGKKEYDLRKAAEKAEEELDEKREKAKRKLEYKQALWTRAVALFQIPVNTGMAIMKAMSTLPPPASFIAAAATAALGAAQIAATVAAPLPKMWTGGVIKSKPGVGTDVTVGERGYDEYIVPDTDYVINRLAQKIKGVTSQKDSSSQSGSSETKANSTGEGFLSIVASDVKIGMDKVGEVLFKVTKSGQGLVAKEAVV